RIHVGPIASGNRVVKDPCIFQELWVQDRNTRALEMEAAAIGATAHELGIERMIIAKGVMDFASPGKNDQFKHYAARASAECLIAFLLENLTPIATTAIPRPSQPWRGPLPFAEYVARHEFQDIKESLLKQEREISTVIISLQGTAGVGKT